MKKAIALISTVVLAAGMFAGCAPATPASTPPASAPADSSSAAPAAEPAKLISIELPSYRCGKDEPSVFFLAQIDRFNQKYAGKYEVKGVHSGGSEEHNEKIKQLGMQKKLPVAFQFSDFTYAEKNFFKSEVLYNMADWINSTPDFKKVFVPAGLDYVTQKDGAIYALPLAIMRPTGMFYNTQGFTPSKKISELTWAELTSELKAQKALYGFQTAEQSWILNLTSTAIMGTLPGGTDLLNAGLKERVVDFNNDLWKQTFTMVKELYEAAGWEGGLGKAYPDTENAFLNNIVSIMPNGQWVVTGLSIEKTNWGPKYDGTKVCGDIFPGNIAIANPGVYDWYLSATATPEELEAGKAFLQFINTQEELEAMATAEGGSMPMLEKSDAFKAAIEKNKVMNDFANATNDATVYVPYMHEIATTASMEAFSANLPSFLTGKLSVDDFCKALSDANA